MVRPLVLLFALVCTSASAQECTFEDVFSRKDEAGTVEAVKALLAAGCDPNAASSYWDLPLFQAARRGMLRAMEALLEGGASPNRLGLFAEVGDEAGLEPLKQLLAHGADIDSRGHEEGTALHRAAAWRVPTEAKGCEKNARFRGDDEPPRCWRGNVTLVRFLLARGADPNLQDRFGMTPLHVAIMNNLLDVTALVARSRGVKLTATDLNGQTPLQYAADKDRPELVRTLLNAGAAANGTGETGQTPLHLTRDPRVVRLLLARGAKVGARDADGATSLHYAARLDDPCSRDRARQAAVARLLLEAGAPVKARDVFGLTPLHHAAWSTQADLVQRLLHRGASARDRDGYGLTPLHWFAYLGRPCTSEEPALAAEFPRTLERLRKAGAGLDDVDEAGRTPLWIAYANGQHEAAELLLEVGADVRATGPKGATLLHLLAWRNDPWSAERLLAKAQGRTGGWMAARDADGRTALHWAAAQGSIRMVAFLVGRGAESDAEDAAGLTVLDWAAMACEREVARTLLEAGARPSKVPGCPSPPVHPVHPALDGAVGKRTGTLSELFKGDLDVNARDRRGRTPLHIVAEYNFMKDELERLLERGADPNARDCEGQTPLHVSVIHGGEAVTRRLLLAGADANARDDRGRTPLHRVPFLNTPKRVRDLLVERGGRVTEADRLGRTALHAVPAIGGGLSDFAEDLVCRGAEAAARDAWGWSFEDHASVRGWPHPLAPRRFAGVVPCAKAEIDALD
jgi:cytohesin